MVGLRHPPNQAYRLRKTVKCHVKSDSLILVLSCPLKAIILDPFWKDILNRLEGRDFIPLDEIISLADKAEPQKVEFFLDNLVRKGFLEREGFSLLRDYPFVSIIIPVRNRPEDIADCLRSLIQLDYPSEKMEIIVVDDASIDNTPTIIAGFPVKLIGLKENKQASFCRNLATQEAQGEILAFIDSDCLADPFWLKELVPAFGNRDLGAVGGIIDTYLENRGLDRYEKVRSSLKVGDGFKGSEGGDRFFYVPSCNLLVRKDPFIKIGGFREDLHVGEDVDLCWRLLDHGSLVEYRPLGRVFHKHRTRLISFCSRRFDYGTSEPLLQQLHLARVKEFLFPPGASLFWVILLLSISLRYTVWSSLGAIILISDSIMKLSRIRGRNIPVTFPRVLLSAIRSYLTFIYHCCAFISRYYLLWFFILFPFFTLSSLIILGAHLVVGLVDFFIKKPCLNLLLYLFYFSLEQLSYQLGVWW